MSDTHTFSADHNGFWCTPGRCWPKPERQVRDWLLDSGSLTRRLKKHADGTFGVRVLEEGWRAATSSQMLLFAGQGAGFGASGRRIWSRRVELCLFGEPWVAAHSLIPYSTVRGSLRQLSVLEDRPLGAFLFDQPGLMRHTPQLTRVKGCWGRRSMFVLRQRPLIVAEYFLPAMLKALQLDVGI